jgi:hypothetical protein
MRTQDDEVRFRNFCEEESIYGLSIMPYVILGAFFIATTVICLDTISRTRSGVEDRSQRSKILSATNGWETPTLSAEHTNSTPWELDYLGPTKQ